MGPTPRQTPPAREAPEVWVARAYSATPPVAVASNSYGFRITEPEVEPPPPPPAGQRKPFAVGTNLSGVADWRTQMPFIDLMKQAREWRDWRRGGAIISEVDERGWVRSLAPDESASAIFWGQGPGPRQPITYERLMVRWRGRGTLSFAGAVIEEQAEHQLQIRLNADGAYVTIETTDPEDPIRDLSIVPVEHVPAFERGEIFNPDWIALIREQRVLRFMDWIPTNSSGADPRPPRWEDRPRYEDRSWAQKGVPLEVMIRLANQLDADPWFTMPHLADEAWVTAFATYVRDHLAGHLVAYTEYSNEVWNFIYDQAQYGIREAEARWGRDVSVGWVQYGAMRAAQNCELWKEGPFAGQTERVRCVMGMFTGWTELSHDTLECPAWAAEGELPCWQHGIDVLGVTGYFTGCLQGDPADPNGATNRILRGWFSDPDGGVQKAIEQIQDGRHFPCDDTMDDVAQRYSYFVAEAAERGLKVVAYEGGSHVSGNGHASMNDTDFEAFYTAVNRSPGMGELYLRTLRDWRAAGGETFVHFVDVDAPTKYGAWGALEHLKQPGSPKWNAISQFNQERCWWSGCETAP